jgi:hypothetical protein
MRRSLRILIGLAAGAAIAPLLPIYVSRDMTRAFMVGGGGDRIEYGWSFHRLGEFLEAMQYMRPEQTPQRLLAINLGVAAVCGLVIALIVMLALGRLTGARRVVA